MRRMFDHVIRAVSTTGKDGIYLATDGDHRRAEPIQFRFRFALGRFDHQSVHHRERRGWRMETEVHQTLADVAHFHAFTFPYAAIQNHLVRATAIRADIQRGVVILQGFLDVVGIENGHPGRICQPRTAHHLDVAVGNQQNQRAAKGGCGHRVDALFAAGFNQRVRR